MATLKLNIFTQYQENYSDTKVPYWKNKGAHEFEIDMAKLDFDQMDWMYKEDEIMAYVKRVINSMCNESVNYIYVSHEMRLADPQDITELMRKEMYQIK
jgi:hypothetical protein